MPQTKPMMWMKFMILINLILMIMSIKMNWKIDHKQTEPKKFLYSLTLMQW